MIFWTILPHQHSQMCSEWRFFLSVLSKVHQIRHPVRAFSFSSRDIYDSTKDQPIKRKETQLKSAFFRIASCFLLNFKRMKKNFLHIYYLNWWVYCISFNVFCCYGSVCSCACVYGEESLTHGNKNRCEIKKTAVMTIEARKCWTHTNLSPPNGDKKRHNKNLLFIFTWT